MEPSTIIRINNVLRDTFFRAKYKFSHNQIYLDQAVDDKKRTYEDSPWGTLGLYYFNAVYDGSAKREGKYDAYFRFLGKVRELVDHVTSRQSNSAVLLQSQR
jgi:hypothetical protein